MEFSRQEYCSKLPFPSPEGLPDPAIEPVSPELQANSSPLGHWGSRDHGVGEGKPSFALLSWSLDGAKTPYYALLCSL